MTLDPDWRIQVYGSETLQNAMVIQSILIPAEQPLYTTRGVRRYKAFWYHLILVRSRPHVISHKVLRVEHFVNILQTAQGLSLNTTPP